MKVFKYGLILSALSLFVFACSQSMADNNTNAITQNVNGTSISGETAPTNSTVQPVSSELADAKKIYAENCVICHKENGEGGKVNLDGAEFNVPNYKSDRAKNKSDEKLLDFIVNGDDEMPSFKGKISPEDMKSLVKFIRKDFQGK